MRSDERPEEWRRAQDSNPQRPCGPGAFKAPALPVRLALRGRPTSIIAPLGLLRRPEVRLELPEEPGHELRMPPAPAVLHVEVHHRAVDARKTQLEVRLVSVLLLAHHEDAVRPEQEDRKSGGWGKG